MGFIKEERVVVVILVCIPIFIELRLKVVVHLGLL
jgi:hypothetical protein